MFAGSRHSDRTRSRSTPANGPATKTTIPRLPHHACWKVRAIRYGSLRYSMSSGEKCECSSRASRRYRACKHGSPSRSGELHSAQALAFRKAESRPFMGVFRTLARCKEQRSKGPSRWLFVIASSKRPWCGRRLHGPQALSLLTRCCLRSLDRRVTRIS